MTCLSFIGFPCGYPPIKSSQYKMKAKSLNFERFHFASVLWMLFASPLYRIRFFFFFFSLANPRFFFKIFQTLSLSHPSVSDHQIVVKMVRIFFFFFPYLPSVFVVLQFFFLVHLFPFWGIRSASGKLTFRFPFKSLRFYGFDPFFFRFWGFN